MQYKVPQNVDIADKVIAGLTLRQFMFLMVTGGIILTSNFIFVGPLRFLFLPLAAVLGLCGIALAFLKINDRPLELFLISATKTFLSPAKRVWQKDVEVEKTPIVEKKETSAPIKKSLEEERGSLQKLAAIVDSGALIGNQERLTNIKPREKNEPSDLQDVLTETEQPSGKLEKIIEDATSFVAGQKKEPPVSTMASVHTKKNDFKYDNIGLKNALETEEVVANAKEKQLESKKPESKNDTNDINNSTL